MLPLRRWLLVSAVAWSLTACAGGSLDPSSTTPPEATVRPTPPPSPSTPGSGSPSGAPALAVADLARQLGVEVDQVEVVEVEAVTWRDGSRGCAQPGTSYTQALVDGSRITLRVGTSTYEYHSGGSRAPFLCERPTQ